MIFLTSQKIILLFTIILFSSISFANDYSASTVPYSLKNSLQKGTKVNLCGEKYSDGSGIHWVHTECPKNNNVEGFVIVNGTNLTASKQYCYIF